MVSGFLLSVIDTGAGCDNCMTKEPLKHARLPEGKQWWLGLKPGEFPEHVILTLLMEIPPDYFRKELDGLPPLSGQLNEQLNTPMSILLIRESSAAMR